jgi:hypothetical protein
LDIKPGWVDRVLWLGTDSDSKRDPLVRLQTLGTILLLHAAVESWFWMLELDTFVGGVAALAGVYTILLGIGFVPRLRRLALALAATVTALQLAWTFPYIANHTYLRLLALGLLALPGPGSLRERRLAHAALGWTAAIVLFYTGFQKLVYGTYFQGQYLAYMISLTDRFGHVFEWLVPAGEWTRLKAIGEPVPGAGPYTVDGTAFLALSNLVYVLEIGLAAGLIWCRTRRAAIWMTLGLIVLVQFGAREVFFGLLFCNLVLTLHPRDVSRAMVPVSAAIYLTALLLKWVGWGGLIS